MDTALDGKIAKEFIESRLLCPDHKSYNLIILDMNMPLATGSEVAYFTR